MCVCCKFPRKVSFSLFVCLLCKYFLFQFSFNVIGFVFDSVLCQVVYVIHFYCVSWLMS